MDARQPRKSNLVPWAPLLHLHTHMALSVLTVLYGKYRYQAGFQQTHTVPIK